MPLMKKSLTITRKKKDTIEKFFFNNGLDKTELVTNSRVCYLIHKLILDAKEFLRNLKLFYLINKEPTRNLHLGG